MGTMVMEVKASHGKGWKPAGSLGEAIACHPWQVLVVLQNRSVFLVNPYFENLDDERCWAIAVGDGPLVGVTQVWVKKGGQRQQIANLSEAFAYYVEYVELHMREGGILTFVNDLYGQSGCPTSWSCAFAPASELIPETVAI